MGLREPVWLRVDVCVSRCDGDSEMLWLAVSDWLSDGDCVAVSEGVEDSLCDGVPLCVTVMV